MALVSSHACSLPSGDVYCVADCWATEAGPRVTLVGYGQQGWPAGSFEKVQRIRELIKLCRETPPERSSG